MVVAAPRQARFGFRSPALIQKAQEGRVRATVAHAHAHVPYYRETMRRLILTPTDFCGARDLARLPLIEREQLQRDPEYFVSEQWPPAACVMFRTSGSTDAAVTIFRDPPSFFVQAAHYERLRWVVMQLAGRVRIRVAAITPRGGSTAGTIVALRSRTQLPKNLRVKLRTFAMLPPEELIPELNAWRPHVIGAYGSYQEALFTHVRERHVPFNAPRVAVYGGDPMSIAAREWARDALGIEVLGNYGATEAPHIGFECEHHRGYHVNVDFSPIRLLADDGRDAGAGGSGEVVVSNLVNRGTVLLNYHLGDVASWVDQPCPCGRNLPLSSYLDPAKYAWLDLGDGRTVHAHLLRLTLSPEREIWRYQIVQEARRRFLIRLVPSPECDRGTAAERIVSRCRERLPDDATVRAEFVADLPRGSSGKVQPVVGLPTR
jgi:phenylacetate-CoA ligase